MGTAGSPRAHFFFGADSKVSFKLRDVVVLIPDVGIPTWLLSGGGLGPRGCREVGPSSRRFRVCCWLSPVFCVAPHRACCRFKGCASPCYCSSTSPSPLFTYPWRKRREKTRRALRPRTTLLPPLTRGGYSHHRRSPPRRLSHQPLLLPPLHLLLLLLPLPLLLLPLPLLLLPLSLLLLPLAWRR